jgi:hypothetical protein
MHARTHPSRNAKSIAPSLPGGRDRESVRACARQDLSLAIAPRRRRELVGLNVEERHRPHEPDAGQRRDERVQLGRKRRKRLGKHEREELDDKLGEESPQDPPRTHARLGRGVPPVQLERQVHDSTVARLCGRVAPERLRKRSPKDADGRPVKQALVRVDGLRGARSRFAEALLGCPRRLPRTRGSSAAAHGSPGAEGGTHCGTEACRPGRLQRRDHGDEGPARNGAAWRHEAAGRCRPHHGRANSHARTSDRR